MNPGKALIFCFILLHFVCNRVWAQFPNPADFNTATNATNTGTLPAGTNDLHWEASMTGINGAYLPAVSVGPLAPASWAVSPYPNANWISYPHNCVPNNWNDHSCNGYVDVYYKLLVNLPTSNCAGTSVATPSAYCLTLDYFSDNWVNAVYVNGVLSYTNYIANPGGSWGFLPANGKTVSLCNNWTAGTNTVIVFTTSGSGWGGFLAQANQTVSSNYTNLVTASVSVTNPVCVNGVGSATATAGGPSGPFTYTWLPTGGNSNIATNLSPGNYSVIVGYGACTVTKTLTITQGSTPFNITVSPSATLCEGASTTFTSNGAVSYTWSTGGIGSSLTTSVAGVYSVTGSNMNGCKDTQTVGLTVNPNPTVTVNGNTLLCGAGATTALTANGANTYTWLPGNLNGMTVVVSPPSSTIYSVTGAFVTGCSNTATIDVTVNGSVLSVGPALTICTGESATLTANGMTSYTWMPGNSNSATYIVTPTTSQNYTVTGSVGACTYSASQLVTVSPLPTVSISPDPPPMVCPGTPVSLTASGASTYVWQPGNLNGATIAVSPTSNQVYTVIGTTNGCSDNATVLLVLAPTVNLNVSAPQIICKGDVATFTATGANYYTWEPGNGSGSTFTAQPLHNTTYTVTASNGGTCVATATVNVNVNYVNADFAFEPIKPTYNDYIHFTNISANNTNNFWYFTDQTISGEVNPTIIFEEPGTYVACLLVSDIRGCDDTLCKEIVVGCPEDIVYIPNTFTPNDDGLNDIFRVGTLGQCIEDFEMDIFDRWGEKIFTTKSLEKGWDGKVKGSRAKDDVYVYLVKYTMVNKKAYSKTGHVLLMK